MGKGQKGIRVGRERGTSVTQVISEAKGVVFGAAMATEPPQGASTIQSRLAPISVVSP